MSKNKTHLFRTHGDYRSAGQTNYEYTHSTACGYVRDAVTNEPAQVTCKHCLREIGTQPIAAINAKEQS